jgi:diaminohydroxyphosphoribosylaminopyrimidine deaminase/5-amino-6-(5-phosphoribosylamino)uracil reductase
VARLRGAGVVVDVLPPEHPAARSCRELNIGFFSRMIRRRPWVRLKMAASLDGTSALANGASQWITGDAARADGHAWRARACAVLTGVGTVLADNPRLDVRHCATPRQPHLVIADSHWQTPPDAAVFGLPRTVRIVGTAACGTATEALAARGAQIARLPDDGAGRVDLAAHVEAGPTLSGALLAAALVDELLVYLAPRLLGPGQPLVRLPGIERLEDGHRLRFEQIDRVGDDLRVLARFGAPDPFLSAVSAL